MRTDRLSASLSDGLRRAIRSGEYKAGDRLPSEADLVAKHGVSRTVVREAIAALRADGLVETRQGAGAFVVDAPASPSLPFQDIDYARISSVVELLELRLPVEVEAAGLAALRRSPAQEEAIIEKHQAISRCIETGQPTIEADFDLHLAIAEATNNPRFAQFLRLLGASIIPRGTLNSLELTEKKENIHYLQKLSLEHERIVSAISLGDVESSRDAMRMHLLGSQQRYRMLIRQN